MEDKLQELVSNEQADRDAGTEYTWIEGKEVDESREEIESTINDMRRSHIANTGGSCTEGTI